jgi:Zn-dependent protease with chaperone function
VLYYFYYVGAIPPSWLIIISVGFALGIVLLQWAISPYIIRWIYKVEWIGEDAPYLDPRVARVIEAVRKHTSEAGVRMPKFGIVPDDNPNAFTFGWTRNHAFVVLTRGVFKYCEDDEVEAVAAHEVGHIVHNDFVVMTVVAAVVLLFYVVFRGAITFMRLGGRSRDSGKAAVAALVVAAVSFVVYILANYISLLISRYREYWADEYSAERTRNPNSLSSALVKIAYGLATEGQGHDEKARSRDLSRHSSSLGIFNVNTARALATQAATADGTVSKDAIKETMAWDLWNPWAFFLELGMTHPLPAKRITTLDRIAEGMGQTPYVKFDLVKPESYWDDFARDVAMKYSWLLSLVAAFAIWYLFDLSGAALVASVSVAFCSAIFLAGLFGSIYLLTYRYPRNFR